MGKSKRLAKERLDKFYELAKKHGFRSRAAFKLIQLNKKFDFMKDAQVVVDLCAAPGSWCQVVAKSLGADSKILGVDLYPIKSIPGVITIQGDITTVECKQDIHRILKQEKADLVLHDGAPNVGAAWTKDSYAQAELVLSACRLSVELLRPHGTFVTKIFRSSEYTKLLWVFNQLFERVIATKPQASRAVSAEVFVVCLGYLNPKKIDFRLLNPKFVFTTVRDPNAKQAFVWNKKDVRNRSGYDQDSALLFKKCPISQFISSEDPIALLGRYNELHFENPEDQIYLEQNITDEEIKSCCKDLKVLSKNSFVKLIKWRAKILAQFKKVDSENEEEAPPSSPVLDEDKLIELADEAAIMKQKFARSKLKKLSKSTQLLRAHMVKSVLPEDFEVDLDDGKLFRIDGLKKNFAFSDLSSSFDVHDREDRDVEVLVDSENDESDDELLPEEERRAREDEKLNSQLEYMYNEYLRIHSKNKSNARKPIARDNLDDEQFDESLDETAASEGQEHSTLTLDCDQKDQPDQENLLLQFGNKDDDIATTWFQNDVFNDSSIEDSQDEDEFEVKRRLGVEDVIESVKVAKPDIQKHEESEEEQNYTIDEKAEIMSLAKRLRNPEQKRELIDSCYTRYGYSDHSNLPKWFADDEQRFTRPNLPITKQEVEEFKSQLKAINARSTARVAEARARKKLKIVRAMKKAREKVLKTIGSVESLTKKDMSKLNEVAVKTRNKFRPRKVYQISNKRGVVSRSHGKSLGNVFVRRVDRRLKKDKRASKNRKRK